MASRERLFFVAFAALAGATYFSYNLLCLVVDPYNVVWHRREMPMGAWGIEQFRNAKIRRLAANPERYDGIILANSRATWSRTPVLNQATGRRYFNLTTSVDTPLGYLPKARWLVRTQKNLRYAIVFAAWDQFNTGLADTLLHREHPAVSGESWPAYYWAFANLPYRTLETSLRYYVKRLLGAPVDPRRVANDGFDEETGDVTAWGPQNANFEPTAEDRTRFTSRVKADPSGVIRFHDSAMDEAELANVTESFAAPANEKQLAAFAQTIAVFRDAGVEVECVVPAMPALIVAQFPRDRYIDWLGFLVAQCGHVWDFSMPGSVTRDNYNFIDWSHAMAYVESSMVIKAAGATASAAVPLPDFGRRVSGSGFDQYAVEWRRSFLANPLQVGSR